MRVLQVVTELGYGGLEKVVVNLSLWLSAMGHSVHVVHLREEADLARQLERGGIEVSYCPLTRPSSWIYPKGLVRVICDFNPDVVHTHNMAWPKTAVACLWTRRPCIFTLHGFHSDWLQRRRVLLRLISRHTVFCVGVAPGIEGLFAEILRMPTARVVHIPNGIPDAYSQDPASYSLGASSDTRKRLIGMVARFDGQYKDQKTLLQAFKLVRDRLSAAQLAFIGDGPSRGEVEALTAELGLQPYVHFLGARDDIYRLLRSVDVFVLSSKMEGSPLAVLEAMAAQRPIVATAVGGVPTILANGQCGLLVPTGDAHAMAQAILDLLAHPQKAQELALRARERFLQEYTVERMGERYLRLYESALRFRRRKE